MFPKMRAIGELRCIEACQEGPLEFRLPQETIGECFMAPQLSQGKLDRPACSVWVVKKHFHN